MIRHGTGESNYLSFTASANRRSKAAGIMVVAPRHDVA